MLDRRLFLGVNSKIEQDSGVQSVNFVGLTDRVTASSTFKRLKSVRVLESRIESESNKALVFLSLSL